MLNELIYLNYCSVMVGQPFSFEAFFIIQKPCMGVGMVSSASVVRLTWKLWHGKVCLFSESILFSACIQEPCRARLLPKFLHQLANPAFKFQHQFSSLIVLFQQLPPSFHFPSPLKMIPSHNNCSFLPLNPISTLRFSSNPHHHP